MTENLQHLLDLLVASIDRRDAVLPREQVQVRREVLEERRELEPLAQPLFAQLVNERPLSAQEAEDLRGALHVARDELEGKPAAALNEADNQFAGEGLQAMVAAARARLGKEPSLGDVWADLFSQVDKLLEDAMARKRGIYFGNV